MGAMLSGQLVGDLFVQDFLHSERDDVAFGLPPKAVDLRHRVAGVIEGDEEPLLAFLAHHSRPNTDQRMASPSSRRASSIRKRRHRLPCLP